LIDLRAIYEMGSGLLRPITTISAQPYRVYSSVVLIVMARIADEFDALDILQNLIYNSMFKKPNIGFTMMDDQYSMLIAPGQ
jgi:hypothetical protein